MKKQRSQFGINPVEELDLQHQGSLGGQQLVGKYGRNVGQGDISGSSQSSKAELTPGREPAEGPQRPEQKSHERAPGEGQKQETSSKKHHYK